jgi:hypothetical protein
VWKFRTHEIRHANVATSDVPVSIDIGCDDQVRLRLSSSYPDIGWLLNLYKGDEDIGQGTRSARSRRLWPSDQLRLSV